MASSFKHIIWDWNGTLLNDTWLCVEVLNGLLARWERMPISEDRYRQNFGFPVIHFYDYLGFETDGESFQRLSRDFIDDYESRWLAECSLHSDTPDILTQLTVLGLTHSVLSAAKQEALEVGINHFGIRDHFIGLMGTDNIYAEGKIEQGRKWIEELHWAPEEVVLIGDTLHDFEVAQAIGSACILVTHGHHSPGRLAGTGAPVVDSLAELVDHFVTAQ
jgi:phosphoglycolate phosphatase